MESNVYERKAQLLSLGLPKKVKQLDIEIYNAIANGEYDLAYYEMIFCNENHCTLEDVEDCRKINNSNYHRVKRLTDRITEYLQMGVCVWLTLTFNESALSNTNNKQRRRYVREYLKSQSDYYVANIDYGKTTEREHYHALLVCNRVDMSKWTHGFAYTERIKNHVKTSVKLAKYVSKLTNHAVKETTKRCCYLYSR